MNPRADEAVAEKHFLLQRLFWDLSMAIGIFVFKEN